MPMKAATPLPTLSGPYWRPSGAPVAEGDPLADADGGTAGTGAPGGRGIWMVSIAAKTGSVVQGEGQGIGLTRNHHSPIVLIGGKR